MSLSFRKSVDSKTETKVKGKTLTSLDLMKNKILVAAGMEPNEANRTNLPAYINIVKSQR